MDIKNLPTSNYDKIRNKLKTGDLLLFAGEYAFSKGVKLATDSIFTHVAVIIIFKTLDRIMVYESVEGKGARLIPLSLYLKEYKGMIIVKRHKDFSKINDFKAIGQLVFDNQGKEYDTFELYRILWRKILEKIGIKKLFKITFKQKNNDKLICSEAQQLFYSSLGLTISNDGNACITPADFAENKDFKFIFRIK